MFDSFVLGVDPGLSRCGYAVASVARPLHQCVSAGLIRTDRELPLPQRLFELEQALDRLCEQFRPERLAIERVLFQSNVRTAMSVAQASGIAMLVAARRGIEVVMFSPNEVKLALTGDGAASKSQMQAMLPRVFALDVPIRQADAADALALAFCGLHSHVPTSLRSVSRPSSRLAQAIAAASTRS